MGRDTVQLETAVNTIPKEYLLEFTSEYGIPEALHPELLGPEDRIVDFPEGKARPRSRENTGYTPYPHPETAKDATLLSGNKPQIIPGGRGVKAGSRSRAAHEVSLLTVTANRVIEMKDPAAATDSSGVPSTIERSPLDFANEAGASDQGTTAPEVLHSEDVPTTRGAPEAGQAKEVTATDPSAVTESRKRGHDGIDTNAPLKLGMASTRPVHVPESALANVSDPDPLSFADPQSRHPADVAQSSQGTAAVGDPESKNASFASAVGSSKNLVDHVAPPGYFFKLRHQHNDDFLRQYNVNLARQVAMGSQLRLRFEHEAKLLRKSVARVARRDKRIQAREHEIKNLEALCEAETKYIAALQALKYLKYPLVDQLEGLKDAPMDVIMAAMYLESDTGDDAPQWVRDLHPSSSHLTIPVYPKVRDPVSSWACKEEMLLVDAIAANVSRAENKKKCRII
nr:hypothetical protein [Tanacetum cinerariifolium]